MIHIDHIALVQTHNTILINYSSYKNQLTSNYNDYSKIRGKIFYMFKGFNYDKIYYFDKTLLIYFFCENLEF